MKIIWIKKNLWFPFICLAYMIFKKIEIIIMKWIGEDWIDFCFTKGFLQEKKGRFIDL